MAWRSKFVTSRPQRLGLTHFLAIPLVPPRSRSQSRDSFRCLWDDLAAIDVPTDAIRPLGYLHLSLDILLRLDTPEHVAKATEILQRFPIKQTPPTTHASSTSENLFRHSSMALPSSNDDTNSSMAPPGLSVSGLFCTPGKEAETLSLSAIVYDATHRVGDWKLRIAHAYRAAGFRPKSPLRPRDSQIRAATKNFLDSSVGTVRLMQIHRSAELVPCKWKPEKLINPCLPSIDARGLLDRYKNHVWIENAPLERVSICKMGFQKPMAKELREVASVPL